MKHSKKNLYRLAAEWEAHEATWIGWPHNASDWPNKLPAIHWVYAEIVRMLCEGEKVRILVNDKSHEEKARKFLSQSGTDSSSIEFFRFPTDRGWLRDMGACFVDSKRQSLSVCGFKFNAWAKYANWKKDSQIAKKIAKKLKLSLVPAVYKNKEVVLEGGAIDVNGEGTILTSEECLLDTETQVRNVGFEREDWESVFSKYLGANHTIWLGKGIAGDDTHGHIDDICRFVNRNTVVLVQESNRGDENYLPLNENRERLQDRTLGDGSKLQVVYLPMPDPLYFQGNRLPASYANFYIANDTVLVPTFNDPKDREALGILAELFPYRKVVGIHSVDLVWGFGTLHCLSREQPLAKK